MYCLIVFGFAHQLNKQNNHLTRKSFQPRISYLNEQKTIEVNNYKFDSDTYKALFTFNNGTLNNISLELKDDGFDEDFIKSKFKKMQSKFSKIYGAPIKSATISPIISVIFFFISDQKDKSESWSKSDGALYLTLNNNKIFLKLEGNKF